MHKQLQTRILTALVFAPLLLAAIFLFEPFVFSFIMAAVFLYGGWEFSSLCKFTRYRSRILFTVCQGLVLLAGLLFLGSNFSGDLGPTGNWLFIVIALTALWGFSRFSSGVPARAEVRWTAVSTIPEH